MINITLLQQYTIYIKLSGENRNNKPITTYTSLLILAILIRSDSLYPGIYRMAPRIMTNLIFTVVYFVLLSSVVTTAESTFAEAETALRLSLLDKLIYDKHVPPKEAASSPIQVKVGLSFTGVENLDEVTSTLTSHVWLKMHWDDFRLKWKPEEHGNVSTLAIPFQQVWRPDIVPYNGAMEDFSPSSDFHVVALSSGSVIFVPHIRLKTFCNVRLEDFPFDTQICKIKMGSWVHNNKVMTLRLLADQKEVDTTHEMTTDRWRVTNSSLALESKKYSCCEELYENVMATLHLERRAHLMKTLYVGPSVCFGLVTPVVFLLPAASTHKMVLGGSLLIAQVLMLEMLADSLPVAHFTVPTIASYFLANIVLLAFSLACSALVINYWEKGASSGKPVPRILEKIFLGDIARCLCVNRGDYVSESRHTVPEDNFNTDDTVIVKDFSQIQSAGWRQLSVVIDRMLLALFVLMSLFVMFALVRHAY